MKNQIQAPDAGTLSTKSLITRVLRNAIGQPITLVLCAALIVGAGLYLNWPTIVALGLAPLVLMLAPCTLMCALGLCGKPRGKNKANGESPRQDDQP